MLFDFVNFPELISDLAGREIKRTLIFSICTSIRTGSEPQGTGWSGARFGATLRGAGVERRREHDVQEFTNNMSVILVRAFIDVISRLKSTHLHLAHWEAILPQFVALAPANSSVQILQVLGILIGRTIRILQVS